MGKNSKWILGLASLGFSMTALGEDCQSWQKQWPYENEAGGERFAIGIDAGLTLQADCQAIQARTQLNSNARLFSNPVNLLYAGVEVGMEKNDQRWLLTEVAILGFELDTIYLENDQAIGVELAPEYLVDQSDDYSFSYGPITIPLEWGVSGTAKVELEAGVQELGVKASATPSIDVDGFASASLWTPFLRAKIQGDMKLLDEAMENSMSFGLKEGENGLGLEYDVYSGNQLNALDGSINFVATSPWARDRKYEAEVFSWDGYDRSDDIVDASQFIELN